MPKRLTVLVNGLTLDDANLVPLVKKITFWQSKNTEVLVLGSRTLSFKLRSTPQIKYLDLGPLSPVKGGFHFLIGAVYRNFMAVRHLALIPEVKNVYSISSVLDLTILPYILKKIGRVRRWVTVFDNTVPMFANGKLISGNKILRLLAWVSFQISLFLLRSADYIFVVKPELKQYLVKKGFNPRKLIITGNGVEKDLILKAKSRNKYLSDALYVGRINEAKGIYDLLEVLKVVKKVYPKFSLTLVGSGDEKTIRQYKMRVQKMKLASNVRLLGFKTGQEKYDIIKSCKLFLFLSQTESVPVAPLEAVCSGKPVLVYQLDAYNMYKNNEIMSFKQGDIHSVAAKIISIFRNKSFVNPSGALLLDKHDWDAIADKELKHLLA